MADIAAIQRELTAAGLDGWLFYDFRGSDPLAASILGLKHGHQTRRWFYFVPSAGAPTRLVHAIETGTLDALPGDKRVYLPWQQLHQTLGEILSGRKRIAMQYSPGNAIPYISRVDAGTIELVRSFGIEVVSSADLVQTFEAVLSDRQLHDHEYAANVLGELVDRAFAEIAHRLKTGIPTSELDIQQFMMQGYDRAGLVTDHPPIVAVGPHSADPHFAPTPQNAASIRKGDFVLLDTWAKRKEPGAVFADITWTAYVGDVVPEKYAKVFDIVARARDAAVHAIRSAHSAGRSIRGCDADDACREVIRDAGYGEYFIHRTGHSIHTTTHGNGANLDNLETSDERRLVPRTLFSVEPGIYLPGDFGVRSEIDVYLPDARSALVTGRSPQTAIVPIKVD